jgi:hypothetical protein
MDEIERRLLDIEAKLKTDLGDDNSTGQVWRVVDSYGERLSHLDGVIWRGADSINAQILKLRTEIRTIGIVVIIAIPVVLKGLEWFAR